MHRIPIIVRLCGALSLFVAILAATADIGASASTPAVAARTEQVRVVVPHDAHSVGPLSPSKRLTIDIVLKPSHGAQLSSLLTNLYDPSSAQYHQWLAPGQFDSQFGPGQAQLMKVRSWLAGAGLPAGRLNGFNLVVSAPAGKIAHALQVRFNRYQLQGAKESFSATTSPAIPVAVSQAVQSVVGLNDFALMTPGSIKLKHSVAPTPSATPVSSPRAPAACGTASIAGATADNVAAHYAINGLFNEGLTGANQSIAMYELAAHSPSDVATYFSCFGLTNPVSTVPVFGGGGINDGTVEADIDIEEAASQAPSAQIISYEGPNNSIGIVQTWSTIITQDTAKIVSTSWGECESDQFGSNSQVSVAGAIQTLFSQALTQGQSIYAASGDSGVQDCFPSDGSRAVGVDYPASSPAVTAMGGTVINADQSESVWDDRVGSSGGGLSTHFVANTTQQPYLSAVAPGSSARGVPDLSADASGEAFFASGTWSAFDGTSITAPLMSGITADVDQGCTQGVGLMSSDLYNFESPQWSTSGIYGVALNDVTTGNNDFLNLNGGNYHAGVGYDLASGLGTPIATGLACPQVNSIQPSTAAPGATVTLQGINLASAHFSFGGVGVIATTATSTSATVVVPTGSGTINVTAGTPIGTGTTSASFTFGAPPAKTTSTGPTSVAAAPTASAAARITIVGTNGQLAAKTVTLKVTCKVAECHGVVHLTRKVTIGNKTITQTLGSATYRVAKNRVGATIHVTLNPTGVNAAAGASNHRLVVSEIVTVAGGATKQKSIAIVL